MISHTPKKTKPCGLPCDLFSPYFPSASCAWGRAPRTPRRSHFSVVWRGRQFFDFLGWKQVSVWGEFTPLSYVVLSHFRLFFSPAFLQSKSKLGTSVHLAVIWTFPVHNARRVVWLSVTCRVGVVGDFLHDDVGRSEREQTGVGERLRITFLVLQSRAVRSSWGKDVFIHLSTRCGTGPRWRSDGFLPSH